MCEAWGRILMSIGIGLRFDDYPDPDLDRHQHGNSDPDRHQKDAETQRALY
jgi:hypothetical protein